MTEQNPQLGLHLYFEESLQDEVSMSKGGLVIFKQSGPSFLRKYFRGWLKNEKDLLILKERGWEVYMQSGKLMQSRHGRRKHRRHLEGPTEQSATCLVGRKRRTVWDKLWEPGGDQSSEGLIDMAPNWSWTVSMHICCVIIFNSPSNTNPCLFKIT